jgi:hypothetical protein
MIVWSEQDWDFEGLIPFVAGQRRPIVDVELPVDDVEPVCYTESTTTKGDGDGPQGS